MAVPETCLPPDVFGFSFFFRVSFFGCCFPKKDIFLSATHILAFRYVDPFFGPSTLHYSRIFLLNTPPPPFFFSIVISLARPLLPPPLTLLSRLLKSDPNVSFCFLETSSPHPFASSFCAPPVQKLGNSEELAQEDPISVHAILTFLTPFIEFTSFQICGPICEFGCSGPGVARTSPLSPHLSAPRLPHNHKKIS